MGTQPDKFIAHAHEALESCGDLLGRLAATCCMPGRSPKMNDAFALLRDADRELQFGEKTPEALAASMARLADCGARIGNLYVTCCTETREPLYREMLAQLNRAWNSLGAAAGQGH